MFAIDAVGVGEMWQRDVEGGKVQLFGFISDLTIHHTFWTQLIGGITSHSRLCRQTNTSATVTDSQTLSKSTIQLN